MAARGVSLSSCDGGDACSRFDGIRRASGAYNRENAHTTTNKQPSTLFCLLTKSLVVVRLWYWAIFLSGSLYWKNFGCLNTGPSAWQESHESQRRPIEHQTHLKVAEDGAGVQLLFLTLFCIISRSHKHISRSEFICIIINYIYFIEYIFLYNALILSDVENCALPQMLMRRVSTSTHAPGPNVPNSDICSMRMWMDVPICGSHVRAFLKFPQRSSA